MSTTENPALDTRPGPSPGSLRRLGGVRLRILGWYVVLLALSIAGTLLLERNILIDRLEDEVESQLLQERGEVENLAGGNDPETGQPFGTDVAAVFDTFLRRNVPGESEAFLTLVDGQPYLATAGAPYPPRPGCRRGGTMGPAHGDRTRAAGDARRPGPLPGHPPPQW